MIIHFDFDNDAILIGDSKEFDKPDSNENSNILRFSNIKNMREILPIICEFANRMSYDSMCEKEFSVTIQKQDEGEITTVEDY